MIARGKKKKGRKKKKEKKQRWATATEFNEVRLMYKKKLAEQRSKTPNSREEQVPGFEVTTLDKSRGRMQASTMRESLSFAVVSPL